MNICRGSARELRECSKQNVHGGERSRVMRAVRGRPSFRAHRVGIDRAKCPSKNRDSAVREKAPGPNEFPDQSWGQHGDACHYGMSPSHVDATELAADLFSRTEVGWIPAGDANVTIVAASDDRGVSSCTQLGPPPGPDVPAMRGPPCSHRCETSFQLRSGRGWAHDAPGGARR